jgi:hypothetical protein
MVRKHREGSIGRDRWRASTPIQTMVIIVQMAITENRFVYQIERSIKRSN